MNVSPKYFVPLPDNLLDVIFEFASEGPFKLAFDTKKQKFVERINKNFALLNKAIQFKIYHPPEFRADETEYYFEDPEEQEIYDNMTNFQLIFTFPLKLKTKYLNPMDYTDKKRERENLTYFINYELNKKSGFTQCSHLIIPGCYHTITKLAVDFYKKELKKTSQPSLKKRIKNMIKGFETESYAKDTIIF